MFWRRNDVFYSRGGSYIFPDTRMIEALRITAGRDRRHDVKLEAPLSVDLGIDLYDYQMARERKPRPKRRRKWSPTIADDWPEQVPVFVEELELYELYLGDELDRILGIAK